MLRYPWSDGIKEYRVLVHRKDKGLSVTRGRRDGVNGRYNLYHMKLTKNRTKGPCLEVFGECKRLTIFTETIRFLRRDPHGELSKSYPRPLVSLVCVLISKPCKVYRLEVPPSSPISTSSWSTGY